MTYSCTKHRGFRNPRGNDKKISPSVRCVFFRSTNTIFLLIVPYNIDDDTCTCVLYEFVPRQGDPFYIIHNNIMYFTFSSRYRKLPPRILSIVFICRFRILYTGARRKFFLSRARHVGRYTCLFVLLRVTYIILIWKTVFYSIKASVQP